MTNGEHNCGGGGGAVSTPSWASMAITVNFKRKILIKKGSVLLRGFALLFSLIAFLVMHLNRQGDHLNFTDYNEYKYEFAAVIVSGMYTAGHLLLNLFGQKINSTATLMGCICDQVMANLLLSAASAAIPLTIVMRESPEYSFHNPNFVRFCDSSAAAIAMTFFAFLSLLLSSLVAAYTLYTSHHTSPSCTPHPHNLQASH